MHSRKPDEMLSKATKLHRHLAPAPVRRFCPNYMANSLAEIDPAELVTAGFHAVLLDVDNTLIPWRSMKFPDETIEWISTCKAAGLKLCIVSNTRNKPRLKLLSEKLGIPFASGRMKPARAAFLDAIKLTGVPAHQTVMIGDQMFTDVWGANRLGMCTIWVMPMHPKEFIGTKISRLAEKVVSRFLKRARQPE